MKKIELIQLAILWGFIALYAIALAVNAAQAAMGLEHLAVHHWPLFAGITAIGWKSLTPDILAGAKSIAGKISRASGRTVKKAAQVIVAYHIGAVRCLFALFAEAFSRATRI